MDDWQLAMDAPLRKTLVQEIWQVRARAARLQGTVEQLQAENRLLRDTIERLQAKVGELREFQNENLQLRASADQLQARIDELQRENLQLRGTADQLQAKVDELQREILELRQQAGYWKSRFQDQQKKIAGLEAEKAESEAKVRQLQDQQFGRKSEKPSADRSNTLHDPDDPPPQNRRRRGQQPGRRGPRRRDYSHLPTEEEIVELPEGERACPHCGQPRVPLEGQTEDSEQIEIEIKIIRRVIRRQRYRATCHCGTQRTFTAPAPPKLIPKSRLGLSLWLELLLEKFAQYRPIHRLLEHWRSLGLDLAPGTVTGGLRRLVPLLQPIYEALLKRNAQSVIAQADETRWLVFIDQEGKVGHLWWLWVFVGEDTTVYRLDHRRSHDVPEGHYPRETKIVLMVDRYAAYKAMAQVKQGDIVLAFCWAHVRRDFIKVGKGWPEFKRWALDWLQRIRELYRLNGERLQYLNDRPRFSEADARLRQAVAAMLAQARKELDDPSLRLACRQVLESLINHWEGLTRFVDDPRIPMDNNRSERKVRGPALGRKNYYGSAAAWSGQLAAILFSIMATLKQVGLNPRLWLRWYLEACAAHGGKAPADIEPYLPWNLNPEQRQKLARPEPPQADTS